MTRILIHTLSHDKGRLFAAGARDNSNEPYVRLRESLGRSGYELRTADDCPLDGCQGILFWDAVSVSPYAGLRGKASYAKSRLLGRPVFRDVFAEACRMGLQDRLVLMLWEPPSVSPDNWDPEIHRKFDRILTWHDDLLDGQRFRKLCWPQPETYPPPASTAFAERKLLCNISANKVSTYRSELYSARRATIRYFERRQPAQFDLFGVGWDVPAPGDSPYPSYRGTVKDKWDVLSHYRFSVCYENVSDQPGFITEKIFDCLRSGTVPIYWGAPNIGDWVDAEAFVDRRQFSSDADLEAFLVGVSETDFRRYRDAATDYLASNRFKRFLPDAFAHTVTRALGLTVATGAASP